MFSGWSELDSSKGWCFQFSSKFNFKINFPDINQSSSFNVYVTEDLLPILLELGAIKLLLCRAEEYTFIEFQLMVHLTEKKKCNQQISDNFGYSQLMFSQNNNSSNVSAELLLPETATLISHFISCLPFRRIVVSGQTKRGKHMVVALIHWSSLPLIALLISFLFCKFLCVWLEENRLTEQVYVNF